MGNARAVYHACQVEGCTRMIGRLFFTCAFMGAVFASSPTVQAKESRQAQRLLAMTPDDYARSVTIKGDALEPLTSFDTKAGFQEKYGLLGIVWSDVFLRAYVNKTTKEATFQLYGSLRLSVNSWPSFTTANYISGQELLTAELSRLGSNVDCSMHRLVGNCTFIEDVAFNLTADQVKALANTYTPNARNPMLIRFKGQSGVDLNMFLMPAEAAGLLQAMQPYLKVE